MQRRTACASPGPPSCYDAAGSSSAARSSAQAMRIAYTGLGDYWALRSRNYAEEHWKTQNQMQKLRRQRPSQAGQQEGEMSEMRRDGFQVGISGARLILAARTFGS